MRIRLLCGIAAGIFALAATFMHAQDTAAVTGSVRDSSGASVVGAQVAVTNAERGINRTTVTNSDGEYSVPALPAPGSYNVTVTAQGFKKFLAKGVALDLAQKARIDVALEVGTASTEVTVQGTSVAQVETESSDLSNTISGKEISQLELNGRDFTQLVGLSPGVTNQSGADEGEPGASTVAFSVNGGRTEYNNFEIDGGDALDNGSNTTLNVYPSIDAIAEAKVLTSNYGAQYGKSGSGTVEVETKSGTSQFHGDLYEFVRNDAFNAQQEFQGSVPAYKKNDFGFTIGGPVFIPGHYNAGKQKTFFFWSEEWRREITPAPFATTIVPSVAERGGNFSDVCPGDSLGTPFTHASPTLSDCPGVPFGAPNSGEFIPFNTGGVLNQVPVASDSVGGPVVASSLNMIPLPNTGSNSWTASPSLPMNWRQELFRVDHNLNDRVRASFRYIHDSWVEAYPTPLWTDGTSFPTIGTNFKNPGVSMVAHLTATISPSLLNDFVASYTTDHIATNLTGAWQRGNIPNTFGLFNNPNNPSGIPYQGEAPGISVSGGIFQGGFIQDPGYVPNGPLNANPTFTFRDNMTKIVGTHNLQFGVYWVNAHKNEIPQPSIGVNGVTTFNNANSVTSGNAFADLLIGNIASFTQEEAAYKVHEKYDIYEAYLQDDWHATKRLTLNLGLRMSFFGRYSEKNNLAWNFDPNFYVPGASGVDPSTGLVTGNPYNGWVDCGVTAGVPKGCMTNHWINPAPRIGFAFDPLGNGKWAIRGGYGIFFEHTNGNEANTESLEQYNINTQITSIPNPLTSYASLNPSLLGSLGGTAPLSFVSIPNKATWPYVQQWHFDVQHDIGKGTVATVSYVGTAGIHLTREYNSNQIQPFTGQNPYNVGQPISAATDCASIAFNDPNDVNATATVNGQTVTGSWANNLAVACGVTNNSGVSPAAFYTPYAGIGSITRKDQTAASNYNALEAMVRHNIGGLELTFAYTYSHSIDDSSDGADLGFVNSYNLNAYRATSNFDQTHNISIAYVYDEPFFKHRGLAHALLGGWEWSGITLTQSGTPFSVYNLGFGGVTGDNAGVNNSIATAFSYPDLVGSPKAGVSSAAFGGDLTADGYGPLLFNPAAFAEPTGLTFGDAGRNILRNPWRTNFDMALMKHIPVTESKYFEFRAEAFNVFNHVEYNWLGGDAGSAADNGGKGTATNEISCYGGSNNSAGDPSCASTPNSVNPIFRPSGTHLPRILQFAVKFIF
jgi:Carboxypeptidase regulatory-like domain